MNIKIANITNLQDARYCAAMGFQYLSFSLLSNAKDALSPQQIREITAWLSGTQHILACNETSVENLKAIHHTLPYHYLEIPQADWKHFSFLPDVPVILQINEEMSLAELSRLIEELKNHHQDSKIEIKLHDKVSYFLYESLFPSLFIHVSTLELLMELLDIAEKFPFAFSLREEVLEENGNLDYEKLDDFSEKIIPLS